MTTENKKLLKLAKVLERFPVSARTWYRGIAQGRFPKQVLLGLRAVAWRESDIDALIDKAEARK